MLGCPGETARCFGRRGSAHPSRGSYPGARRRFVERTTGTGFGCRRLLHSDFVAFESYRLGVGAEARRAAGSDEASGREPGRRTGSAVANPSWRCRAGPHPGGGGEPGTTARTEAGNRRGAAQGQVGTGQTGTASGRRTHSARGTGRKGPEGAATRAFVRFRDGHGEGEPGASVAPLARRCGTQTSAGAHAPGAARFVYGPPYCCRSSENVVF